MKKTYIRLFILSAALAMTPGIGFSSEKNSDASTVERYAIYIGSNVGGNNRKLLYAGTDATSFQNTMAEIGGIRKSNSVLLLDPAKDDVDNAMEYISTLIEKNRENARRSEFVFYYSGHSDENALLLGKNKYDYSSLKASISKVPSDVHVVILDSCYSGNFIRTNGGQKQKPFLVDDSSVIKGHAYLSSSSSQESSQESDEIESSFFTNAMITGLRGAADSSGDKKVTLNELYSYAFNETLSKTEYSSAGPQHPNYNITLVGSGDLVLSDISESDCLLTLKKELNGRVIIRDKNEKLVSEINKTPAGPIYLAMETGKYGVTVISESITLHGSFELGERKNYVLGAENLSPVLRKNNVLRGEESDKTELAEGQQKTEEALAFIPITFSVLDNEMYGKEGKELYTNLSFGLLRAQTYRTDGAMISIGMNQATVVNGAQVSYMFNTAKKLNGAQGSSIINYAGEVLGAQGAGCVNIAKSVKYCQGAGIGNLCSGELKGIQGAGIFNIAGGKVEGIQGSSIFNVAYSVDGLQAGLVNVCIDDVDGFQIGLINISRNGIKEVAVSYSTEEEIIFTLNTGSKHLYTVFGLSLNSNNFYGEAGDDEEYVHLLVGLGTRIDLGLFSLDFHIMGNEIITKDETDIFDDNKYSAEWYPSAKAALGFSPVKHFRFFAGAMASLETKGNRVAFERRENNIVVDTSNPNVKIHPEFDVGMKISW
nr:caspase family protein [uncultured Treponema sp.]